MTDYRGFLHPPPANERLDAADYGRFELILAILAALILFGVAIELFRRYHR